MRALTVQQPWAWAIIHGGKDVENRTQAWTYRGLLAIHAGARWSERGEQSPLMPEIRSWFAAVHFGAIIGVVDLVDVHTADWCWEPEGHCSQWAEPSYVEHGGVERHDIVHLVLERPRPVEPIRCKGRLGLWTPPAEVLEQLQAVAR